MLDIALLHHPAYSNDPRILACAPTSPKSPLQFSERYPGKITAPLPAAGQGSNRPEGPARRRRRSRPLPSAPVGTVPALGARSLVVVEQQAAHIPAEWLLLLFGLFRGGAGGSSDLGIALALLHGCVGRRDRCQPNCCAGGDGQWRDI